jgi:threonine dehydratase
MSQTAALAISYADIEAARARIKGQAIVTPLLSSPDLDKRTGGRVFVKAEPLQRTGSFKFRGALNRIAQFTAEEKKRGVAAFSSGNHAQAVSYAAQMAGIKAAIIMPEDAPQLKINNTRGYGAEVILYNRYTQSREELGDALARERGSVLVPPYDDPHVMAGQGTIGAEIVEQLAALGLTPDVLLCCCGGGGLMAGTATALRALSPSTEIYSVEPVNFDDTRRSLEAGHQIANDPGFNTICDAIMGPTPGLLTFPVNKAKLTGGLAVSDAEAAQAVEYAGRVLKVTAEPGGAVALAAVLAGKLDFKGRVVAVVLSGGNIEPALHARIMAGTWTA